MKGSNEIVLENPDILPNCQESPHTNQLCYHFFEKEKSAINLPLLRREDLRDIPASTLDTHH